MRTTQLTQCIQKEEEEDELFEFQFDNQSEPQQNLQTPDFQATKQNEVHSQISSQAQIEQTDQYGFKSKINLKHYKDRKTLNARVEKWRQMINEFEKQTNQLIKERTRKGIPDGLRILAWPLLANIKKAKEQANTIQKLSQYSDFLTKEKFKFEHQIRLDVHRTFPDNVNFQDQTVLSESLVNVLKALSEAIPDMGYCQGLNFLTAALIMVTNDENAFWILYRLMTHYNLTAKYKDPNSLYREFYILDNLIQQYHPITSKILKRHNIDLFYFTTEWFITLFSTALPINLFYRVFEIFLVEGEKTIFRCALAIIHYKEQKFTQLNDFENGLQYLRSNEDLLNLDSNQFINLMLSKYKFSKTVIQQLDQKYKKNQK